MNIPPLCIVQARYKSTRLPHKMLLLLAGETLIARAVRIASEAFGRGNVVVAIPNGDVGTPLWDELVRLNVAVFDWDGDEADVLGRFYHCAHLYRWHPNTTIIRYTPDDPFKDVDSLRRVAGGERLPVEQGGEAFTLAELDMSMTDPRTVLWDPPEPPSPMGRREHLTYALFSTLPPKSPVGQVWTIDTPEDYAAAQKLVGDA